MLEQGRAARRVTDRLCFGSEGLVMRGVAQLNPLGGATEEAFEGDGAFWWRGWGVLWGGSKKLMSRGRTAGA